MDHRIEMLETPAECEIFARNATARKRPDLAVEARRKAVDMLAATHDANSPVESEAFAAVYAYEALLTRMNGKKTRATGTWREVKRYGILDAVQRAVARPQDEAEFEVLREMGLEDLAFEALVLRHEDAFSADAIERARARIAKREQH